MGSGGLLKDNITLLLHVGKLNNKSIKKFSLDYEDSEVRSSNLSKYYLLQVCRHRLSQRPRHTSHSIL